MVSSRALSRWLLLVVTLTILSPHFGWEVMAADAHHDPVSGAMTMIDAHEHPKPAIPASIITMNTPAAATCSATCRYRHRPQQRAGSHFAAHRRRLSPLMPAMPPSHHPDLPDRPPRHAAL
jgi:hypothetical protein